MWSVLTDHSTKEPLILDWTRFIRSPSSICFTAARHVHILGSNYLWLFICLTESKEGSKNVTARTADRSADWDQPLTSWLWSEPWCHQPPPCRPHPHSWQDRAQAAESPALWVTMRWQLHLMCCLLRMMHHHPQTPVYLSFLKQST